MMNKAGLTAVSLGTVFNLFLFFAKFYVGISTNSLSIYCDAINNLGDTFACLIAVLGFFLARKVSELKSQKTQSLCTFVISLIIAATGAYFVYNGLNRLLYPLRIAYSVEYSYIIIATVFAKVLMAIMYICFNKKAGSPVLKAMVLDSFLDCATTIFALMGLFLITKINFAADGVFAIIIGTVVTVSAVKNIIEQGRYLINN